MRESPTIKVLIVDDHHVVREGLRRILETDESIEILGEARNGEEAIAKAVALRPDVVLMDLRMPGIDGIAATREIKEKLPDVNVLVLTLYAEDLVSQAVEAGVSGYLLKDSD
jgi:DNA-binding NarL/FixJ family response regulator